MKYSLIIIIAISLSLLVCGCIEEFSYNQDNEIEAYENKTIINLNYIKQFVNFYYYEEEQKEVYFEVTDIIKYNYLKIEDNMLKLNISYTLPLSYEYKNIFSQTRFSHPKEKCYIIYDKKEYVCNTYYSSVFTNMWCYDGERQTFTGDIYVDLGNALNKKIVLDKLDSLYLFFSDDCCGQMTYSVILDMKKILHHEINETTFIENRHFIELFYTDRNEELAQKAKQDIQDLYLNPDGVDNITWMEYNLDEEIYEGALDKYGISDIAEPMIFVDGHKKSINCSDKINKICIEDDPLNMYLDIYIEKDYAENIITVNLINREETYTTRPLRIYYYIMYDNAQKENCLAWRRITKENYFTNLETGFSIDSSQSYHLIVFVQDSMTKEIVYSFHEDI